MAQNGQKTIRRIIYYITTASPREIGREFHTTNDGFSYWMLALAGRGYPRRNLDSMLKLDVFCSVAAADGQPDCTDLLYLYEFNPPIDLQAAKLLPPQEVFQRVVADLIQSTDDPANFSAKYLFDRHVFQKFAAFYFAHLVGADPYDFGDDAPASDSGSPVPRRPLTPQRSGGAARPRPPKDGEL